MPCIYVSLVIVSCVDMIQGRVKVNCLYEYYNFIAKQMKTYWL